ncbi:hypothetical protein L1887_07452 [Cichorium endivia]|nr:hypothetical protein L1887_07452 [Cichorium endivia]
MAVLLHSISGFFHVKNPTKFQSNTIPNTISPDFNGVPNDRNIRTRIRVTICSRITDLEPWVLIDVKGTRNSAATSVSFVRDLQQRDGKERFKRRRPWRRRRNWMLCPPPPKKQRLSAPSCRRRVSEFDFFEAVARDEIESFFKSSYELIDQQSSTNKRRSYPTVPSLQAYPSQRLPLIPLKIDVTTQLMQDMEYEGKSSVAFSCNRQSPVAAVTVKCCCDYSGAGELLLRRWWRQWTAALVVAPMVYRRSVISVVTIQSI